MSEHYEQLLDHLGTLYFNSSFLEDKQDTLCSATQFDGNTISQLTIHAVWISFV